MKTKLFKRIMSAVVVLVLVAAMLPVVAFGATQSFSTVVDNSTYNDWKEVLLNSLTTEKAGTVWNDKSVFNNAEIFNATGITKNDKNSFLVALSTIGSSMSVTGHNSTSTDTVLVLDVSGSMNGSFGNNDVGFELVEAANASLKALFAENEYNRVGIVLYSGEAYDDESAATVLLPLGRYTSTAENGNFLDYYDGWTGEYISINNNVVIEGTEEKPADALKSIVGATYIQQGLTAALELFLNADLESGIPSTDDVTRKPVLVLMSDGAPTLGSTDFTNPGESNIGTGSYSTAAMGFVTQLTASYVKEQISAKYGADCAFFTLGLGTSKDSIANSVLNPARSSNAIKLFWAKYNAANVGDSVTIRRGSWLFGGRRTVTKIDADLKMNYVDRYFDVSGSSADLAEGLKKAFDEIVHAISLQNKFYPTQIEGDPEHSGFVTFKDVIGQYMSVTDIKGILINNQLHSGADLAKNFTESGGAFGTVEHPNELGHEFVSAVRDRLGLADDDAARQLIAQAYNNGQLSYTDENNFSNYIGWYANANGEFLGFWYDGIKTMPDPADPSLTDATRPVYIIKSYGFLGEFDAEQGIEESDMMYTTVQIRTEIATGEETVIFQIPAALIPLVNYDVILDDDGNYIGFNVGGATEPIRLVYEVALDPVVNELTVKDIVDNAYLAANTDADGKVAFFANGIATVDFFPSRYNASYYFQTDAIVCSDAEGTPATANSASFFAKMSYYTVENGEFVIKTAYKALSKAFVDEYALEGENGLYIPKGTAIESDENVAVKDVLKAENVTETSDYVADFDYDAKDANVAAILGNNGKLTVEPATVIAINKTVDGAIDGDVFNFVLTNLTNESDNNEYDGYIIRNDVVVNDDYTVEFVNGVANVELKADETLYIGGLSERVSIKVEEVLDDKYYLENINGDVEATNVVLTTLYGDTVKATFVNDRVIEEDVLVVSGIKNLIGKDIIGDEFIFVLAECDNDGNVSDDAFIYETRNLADGTFTFDPIVLTEEGTFFFLVAEAQEILVPGVVYDETLYLITVDVVMNEDYQLVATATYSVFGGEEVDGITFNNKYVPGSAFVTLLGNKLLENGSLAADAFEFELYEANENWELGNKLTTATNDAEGNFKFDEIEFDAEGDKYFVVKEVNGGEVIDGIRYDDTVYYIHVSVTDNDFIGKFVTDVEIYDSEMIPQESITFTNVNENITPDNPPTGDSTAVFFYTAMAVVAVIGLAAAAFVMKKKEN